MINKNEKGFALVLSLVLLLVMSLMGGALIVVSSGDHQNNNTSDQYQQAFYVAETGLLEGEKNIINQYMGPWTSLTKVPGLGEGATDDEIEAHALYVAELATKSSAGGGDLFVRHTAGRLSPVNYRAPSNTDCYRSFRNIQRDGFQVTDHVENQNFGTLIEPIFATASNVDSIATPDQIEKEKNFLKRFRYEYFSVNVGSAPYLGFGSSIKKTSSNTESLGTAFKIYACGIMVAKDTALDKMDPEIIIPLETMIVMPN
mgnify:CR=1 FL=1